MISVLFSKEKRFHTVTVLCGIALMSMFAFGMMKTSYQPYLTWIETWAFRTTAVALFLVIMLRGGWMLFKRWPVIVVGGAYLGYAVNYLITHDFEYGPEYRSDLIWQFVSKLFFVIILVDVMMVHNVTKINKQNVWYIVIVILATILAISFNWYYGKFLFFPFLAMYITPISKRHWNDLMLCLAIGCCIAFSVLMIHSILTVPYGESGRYYIGTFESPGRACHVAMGGFLPSIYLLDRAIKLETNKYLKSVVVLISLAMSIFALFAVSMVGNRSMQLASVVAIIAYILTFDWGSQEKNKKYRKRIRIGLSVVLLIGILFIVLLVNLHVDADKVAAMFPGIYLQTKVNFWIGRLQSLGDRNSIRGIFPDGSIINIFDHFSSERVSIWYEVIQKLKLTPSNIGGSAHSIYLSWMDQYGIIAGALLSASALAGAVISCINVIKKRTEYLFPCLCLVAFTAYAGYTASTTLFNVMGFMLLFMQYPLLVQMEDE